MSESVESRAVRSNPVSLAGTGRSWESRRERRGGRTATDEARDDYYGVPPIHRPQWNWLIALYFFFGGIAGGSYVVAGLADLFGGRVGRQIARVGHYVSLAALVPSPLLLILDLGQPQRFHHMLRVVKLRSPMSLGVWGLLGFSGFCGLSALIEAASDGRLGRTVAAQLLLALPRRLIGLLGTGPGFFLGGYTGVLLAVTAVPLWTKNALLMGPLFLASALSNGTAAVALTLTLARRTPREALHRLERLDAIALLAELALLLTVRARLGDVIGRPLHEGRLGLINVVGTLGLGILAPLALQWRGLFGSQPPSRARAAVASLLVLVGGYLFRHVMVYAGRASADDPAATFELTRSRP